MGSRTLTPPQGGAWLHLLVDDPLVVIGPEAVTLIQLGLGDHDNVIDLVRRRDATAPVRLTDGPADPASPPGSAGPVPPPHVVRTLADATVATDV
jgi:hypothetical protein